MIPSVPLATHVNCTVCTGCEVPVPVSVLEVGEFEALLAKDALAEAEPVPVGLKVTVNDTGVPTLTVTGKVRPLMANSVGFAPLRPTEETITVAPLAVSVPFAVPLVPSTTLPTLIGLLTLSVPCAPTAVPDTGIVSVGSCASEVTVTLPLKLPADGGVNVILNDKLCPALKVTGGLIPEMLKPVPLAPAAVMCASDPPVFLIVSVWDEFVPT